MVGLDPSLAGRPSVSSWRCEGGNGSWQHNPMLCLSQRTKLQFHFCPNSARGRLELWNDSGLLGDLGQACLRGSSARHGMKSKLTSLVFNHLSHTRSRAPSPAHPQCTLLLLMLFFYPQKTPALPRLWMSESCSLFPSFSVWLGYR